MVDPLLIKGAILTALAVRDQIKADKKKKDKKKKKKKKKR